MKLNVSVRLAAVRNSWRRTMTTTFSEKRMVAGAADALQRVEGLCGLSQWQERQAGFSHGTRLTSWPMAKCACYGIRAVLVVDQGGWREEVICWRLHWDTVREGYSGLTDRAVPWCFWPQRAHTIWKLFNLSKEDVCQCVLRKLLMKARSPGLKSPRFHDLLLQVSWNTNALKKHPKKNEEEAEEHDKIK